MSAGIEPVKAVIDLRHTEAGGLRASVPSGTRSLMLKFEGEDAMAGVVIEVVNGTPLVPGTSRIPVVLKFWRPESREMVRKHRIFKIWYGGTVGEGQVADDAEHSR